MNRQIRIFMAGALVVIPLAVTAWVVYAVGSWLGGLGESLLEALGLLEGVQKLETEYVKFAPLLGIGLVLVGIYLVGLLTRVWAFSGMLRMLDRLVARVPGVKTIYESVRDLMKLFGGDSKKMGRAVQYKHPGTDIAVLGILTNEHPRGIAEGKPDDKVAVYLPYSYMLGGPTIYVPREYVQDVDMSVDQVLKVAATAHVGAEAEPRAEKDTPE